MQEFLEVMRAARARGERTTELKNVAQSVAWVRTAPGGSAEGQVAGLLVAGIVREIRQHCTPHSNGRGRPPSPGLLVKFLTAAYRTQGDNFFRLPDEPEQPDEEIEGLP